MPTLTVYVRPSRKWFGVISCVSQPQALWEINSTYAVSVQPYQYKTSNSVGGRGWGQLGGLGRVQASVLVFTIVLVFQKNFNENKSERDGYQ